MSLQSSTTSSPASSSAHPTGRPSVPMRSYSYSQSDHIDLTQDDDEDSDGPYESDRRTKRPCSSSRSFNASHPFRDPAHSIQYNCPQSSGLSPVMSASSLLPPPIPHSSPPTYPQSHSGHTPSISNNILPPPFTGPSNSSAFFQHHQHVPPAFHNSLSAPGPMHIPTLPPINPEPSPSGSGRQIIDLTTSPSPPPGVPGDSQLPVFQQGNVPPDLPPKTPVCIGQLTVTALVLYPISYLSIAPNQIPGDETDWAPVRLTYERTPQRAAGQETIHIKTPSTKNPNGELSHGENFGVVEQKVATLMGPMLGKGLIRLDAKVRRGMPNLPILPLQLLVYTPKGNITVISAHLRQAGLLLDHPSLQSDAHRLLNQYYCNPHNPPPGGFARANMGQGGRLGYAGPGGSAMGKWSLGGVHGKSVEVQRSQVDELFKSMTDGEELEEAKPPPEIATTLYPHQRKALTFLLEREREFKGAGGFASLWKEKMHSVTGQRIWHHVITQRETTTQPEESKGAILADDMGLGKTITCVSLIAVTLPSARAFASTPLERPESPPTVEEPALTASHFAGSVWGMPPLTEANSSKAKVKANREMERAQTDYRRACRIKVKSRATLIICPLSTVVNWEDQFREHWKGEVSVVGGAGGATNTPTSSSQSSSQSIGQSSLHTFFTANGFTTNDEATVETKAAVTKKSTSHVREGPPLRVYVYHGNARRPDPTFLADFDAVITTYSTLASEFSKQMKSITAEDDDEESNASDGPDVDENGVHVIKLSKSKKGCTKKRKKYGGGPNAAEATSALQSVHWFRVVLDEAHSIKETSTVGCRASCDLIADRRLCLTGTPVQNKLDDVYALIKFLRLEPFSDKSVWTEYIGTPVKYGQPLGVARLQTVMKCITLRRTKESTAEDGRKILSLPPRRDELRFLKFDQQEQAIYDRFFTESKAEFTNLSKKNEVMKNYVGILQKILRLRQICDHFELVRDKGFDIDGQSQEPAATFDDIVATIAREGINAQRASAIFALLREAGITQCVECGCELASPLDGLAGEGLLGEGDSTPGTQKRGRKKLSTSSRASTRQNSPSSPQPVLTRCQHLYCIGCFRNSVAPGWPNVPADLQRCCSICQTPIAPSDVVEVNPDAAPLDVAPKKKAVRKEKRQRGMPLENFHPSTKIRALMCDLVQFSKANPHSANYDPESIDVQMVDGEGNSIDDGIVKTVVFSQWTTMLDKIEDALEATAIQFERLDGTMKRDERTRAMDALKHDPACEVLLVSLKAGGVGLNLTAAQRVYLMDPYWNPAVENQAVDRIHRLGQTRPVTTVKLIIENSIEARLLEVQKKKSELANMTLSGTSMTKAELLHRRMEELNQLFGT